MMKLIKITVLISLMYLTSPCHIILSEILSNEPGSRVLLEWVEIYNHNSVQINLDNYKFIDEPDTLAFPEGSSILPYSYLIVCRRLLSLDGSDNFESYWGDSTGIWGDSELEDFTAVEMRISLSNSEGRVCILDANDQIIDQYSWNQSSDDGRSIERIDVTDPYSSWQACYAPEGSTPGRENSNKPLNNKDYYIEIEPKIVSKSGINKTFTIMFAAPPNSKTSLYIYDDSARKVAALLEDSDIAFGTVAWDLTDDSNRLLFPGLYILSFNTDGTLNARENIPIVITP